MTREEKLYSMRGQELIAEAEKLGVKLAHKGNSLKESKEKAVQKILAAEAAEVTEESIVEQSEETAPKADIEEPAETAPKAEKTEKKARKSRKKTFEELVAEMPAPENIRFIRGNKGEVIVKIGNKRVFGYSGVVVVVNDAKYIEGLESEKKSYGYRVAPTFENMEIILSNYKKA